MIRFQMSLVPYGDYKLGEHPLTTGLIWTTVSNDGQPAHAYRISIINPEQDHVIFGEIPKRYSGHKNPLHLLAAMVADINLPTLGTNYALSVIDLPINDPRRQKDHRHRIADLAAECVDRIRLLAELGEDGRRALERIEAELIEAKEGIAGFRHGESGPVTDPDVIDDIVSKHRIESKN